MLLSRIWKRPARAPLPKREPEKESVFIKYVNDSERNAMVRFSEQFPGASCGALVCAPAPVGAGRDFTVWQVFVVPKGQEDTFRKGAELARSSASMQLEPKI